MESLAKDCTPLKHRYDSCFNLWFEGYLQPALDHPDRLASFLSAPVAPPEPDSRGSGAHASPPAVVSTGTSLQHGRIITNWSKAFRPRAADVQADGSGQSSSMSPPDPKPVADAEPLDTRGKTRAQIKADEYERACGHLWRQYQGCLKKAIEQNASLSTLLEQAREEHPLRSQDGLKGTVWDPAPGEGLI